MTLTPCGALMKEQRLAPTSLRRELDGIDRNAAVTSDQ